MRELRNFKEIISILKLKDYDYIAFALTPWHAHSVSAAVLKLQDMEDRCLEGLIIIMKNNNETFLINRDFFPSLNVDCCFYSPLQSNKDVMYQELLSTSYCFELEAYKKRNFYVLSQQKPYVLWIALANKIYKNKQINSVICDEGAGSYINTSMDRINIGMDNNKTIFKFLKSCYDEFFLTPVLLKKLSHTNRLYNMCLFEKNEDKVQINKDISKYFQIVMENYLRISDFDAPYIIEKYIIINTQPISKSDMLDEGEIDNLWKTIIHLYSTNGYIVFIKPHPREENVEKYLKMGAFIINEKNVGQELLLMKMKKPFLLLSIFSTTLITVPVFNNIDTYCLAPIVRNMESISKNYRQELDRFINTFENITHMINSLDELPL